MKLSIFTLSLFFVIILDAQQLVYYENFIDNSGNWLITYNSELRTEIKQNIYYIVNTSQYNDALIGQNIFYNRKGNFTVETKIKQISGSGNYGLFVDGNADGQGLYFTLDSDKNVLIFFVKQNLIDTVFNSKIYAAKPLKNYNVFIIKKIASKYYFYLNYHRIYSCEYLNLNNPQTGFYLSPQTKIMVDYLKILSQKAKINLIANPIVQKKENLGPSVNSKHTEVMPVISPDGKTLYFVRDTSNNPPNYNDNDIWYSVYADTGWTKAKNIGKPLNNKAHNFIFAVSPDNNTLFLNGTYTAFGQPYKNGISFSKRQKDNTWSIPEKINVEDFYNLADFQSFTISADRKVIIMSIERKNNIGGLDLYVSFRKDDSHYSKPILLNDTINTPFDESTPFLAPDGKTMYFSSNGLPGYGSSDIFMTHRLDDTYLHWSEPQNLGPYINSNKWDGYFTVDAKGEYAYLVSTDNSLGKEDIFRIKLPKEAKPLPVVLVYGNVYDKKNLKPLKAKVIYKDVKNGEIISTAASSYNGEYKLVLPYGKKYLIYAKKNGYFSLSEFLDLTTVKQYTEIKKDIFLISVNQETNFILKNIRFQKAKATLLSDTYAELDRIVQFLKDNPDIKIIVSGHTNNIGNRQQLINLSIKRAKAVKDYLVSKGIRSDRITTVGYGPDKPIASNETEEGRKKNQRVEFKIIKIYKK